MSIKFEPVLPTNVTPRSSPAKTVKEDTHDKESPSVSQHQDATATSVKEADAAIQNNELKSPPKKMTLLRVKRKRGEEFSDTLGVFSTNLVHFLSIYSTCCFFGHVNFA